MLLAGKAEGVKCGPKAEGIRDNVSKGNRGDELFYLYADDEDNNNFVTLYNCRD